MENVQTNVQCPPLFRKHLFKLQTVQRPLRIVEFNEPVWHACVSVPGRRKTDIRYGITGANVHTDSVFPYQYRRQLRDIFHGKETQKWEIKAGRSDKLKLASKNERKFWLLMTRYMIIISTRLKVRRFPFLRWLNLWATDLVLHFKLQSAE